MLQSFSKEAIQKSIQILRNGGVIGYPTETVYGLGCDIMNVPAIERIKDLKGRDSEKPMLVLIQKPEDLPALTKYINPKAKALMKACWPGPLTLLFEASPVVPAALIGSSNKVGVRISPDRVCEALLAEWKKPLVSTSANPAGKDPAQSGKEIYDYFADTVDMILDDNARISQKPSTIVDVTAKEPKVLREGFISVDFIFEIWESANA